MGRIILPGQTDAGQDMPDMARIKQDIDYREFRTKVMSEKKNLIRQRLIEQFKDILSKEVEYYGSLTNAVISFDLFMRQMVMLHDRYPGYRLPKKEGDEKNDEEVKEEVKDEDLDAAGNGGVHD